MGPFDFKSVSVRPEAAPALLPAQGSALPRTDCEDDDKLPALIEESQQRGTGHRSLYDTHDYAQKQQCAQVGCNFSNIHGSNSACLGVRKGAQPPRPDRS
ncbi:hypothetical protein WJX73_008356 [Symbiochloris irregularis]|uniref:Uncharacterized protein n=1 Tax=Symbiochloris irregularis TaxID=706552 RepID=A0AAW1PK63_9CHLO